LQQSVGDDTDPDVDGLDVDLDLRDRLFDVGERRVVRELFSSVVDFALHLGQTIVDILQFGLEGLHIFAHCREAILDVAKLVCMRAVVARHSLEVPRQNLLLSLDFIQSAARVLLETFQLAAYLGQRILDFI